MFMWTLAVGTLTFISISVCCRLVAKPGRQSLSQGLVARPGAQALDRILSSFGFPAEPQGLNPRATVRS